MKLDYFSPEEDQRFSDIVVSYNAMKDNNKEAKELYEFIKERTNLLLYLIPIRNLFLEHDEAADIYVALYDKIDQIIHSFRVSSSTYNCYLTHICRHRAIGNFSKKYRREQTEMECTYHDFMINNSICDEMELGEVSMHYGVARPEAQLLDLSHLFEFIVETQDGKADSLSATEKELREMIDNKRMRRMLLVYLLHLPSSPSPRVINSLSKVLDIDSLVIARFFELKHNLLIPKLEKKEENYEKGIKHWKLMLGLMKAMELECDREKRKSLETKYDKLSRCHEKRMKAASQSKGLSQEEISMVVDESRASIYKSISTMRNMVRIIAKGVVALEDE